MVKFRRHGPVEDARILIAMRQAGGAALALLALAGCAQGGADDAAWWRTGFAGSLAAWIGPEREGIEPPPAEGRPFPNLASVPRPPAPVSAAERQAEMARLAADRDSAQVADARLRGGSGVPSEVGATPRMSVVMGDIDLTRAPDGTDEAVLESAIRLARAEQGTIRLIDGPGGASRLAEATALARLRQDLTRRGLPADRLVIEARGARPLVVVEY
jgi:hypothetical protein